MKRVLFFVGASVGFVLGARAGRERFEQIAGVVRTLAHSAPIRQAGELTRRGLESAADGIGRLTGELQEKSKAFPDRVVHTTESLREELSRRYAAVEESANSLVERTREMQAAGFVEHGDLRDEMLDSLESDDDEMIGGTRTGE